MEPINLNGKVFCSNCGLTIGNAEPEAIDSKIFNFSDNQGEPANPPTIPDTEQAVVPTYETASTPITDQAKVDLGIISPNDESSTPNDLDESPISTVVAPIQTEPTEENGASTVMPQFAKLSVSTDEQPVPNDPIPDNEEIGDTNAEPANVEVAGLPVDTEDVITATEAVEPLGTGVDSLGQEAISVEPQPQTMAENEVVKVDETSTNQGLLGHVVLDEIPESQIRTLDIPSESDFEHKPELAEDSNVLSEQIKQVDTLGASGILLDILNDQEKAEQRKEGLTGLEAAKKVIGKISVDENLSKEEKIKVKPTTESDIDLHSAGVLEDAPQNPVEFPEITSPLDELEITNGKESDEQIMPEDEDTREVASDNDGVKDTKNDTEKQPDNEVTTSSEEGTVADEEQLESKIKTLEPEVVEISEIEATKYDPDSIPSNVKVAPLDKQEILADYFKSKINSKEHGKKAPVKTSKNKTKSNGGLLKEILIIVVAIVIVVAGVGAVFYYINTKNPVSQYEKATEQSSFKTQSPKYVIEGYSMDGSTSDQKNKLFTVKYTFSADNNKTIEFIQAEPKDQATYLRSFTQKDGTNFIIKTVDGTEYTEINGNTLVWTKNSFVFTLLADNYDLSNDLLYKMAKSVE